MKSRPSLFNSQFIHKIKIYFPYTNLLYFLERRDFSVGNFQKRDTFIPYNVPDITDAEINEEVDTLRSGWLAKGPKTLEFEKRFAAYLGAKHAVAVNSCTAALHVALLSQDIGPGD